MTPRAVHARQALRLLRLWAAGWRTVAEVRAETGHDRRTLQAIADAYAREGALHVRNRPHEVGPDGCRSPGGLPREFRLKTDWAGL